MAKEVSQRTDPVQDIQFIKGPIDILDHSSRRFSFGSKIGIDATIKWPEELENSVPKMIQPFIDLNSLLKKFPEISDINDKYLSEGISLVIMSVKKNRVCHVREISEEFIKLGLIRDIKFLLFLDQGVDIYSSSDVVWIAGNNIDPMRDCFNPISGGNLLFPMLVLDGTRKTSRYDMFRKGLAQYHCNG